MNREETDIEIVKLKAKEAMFSSLTIAAKTYCDQVEKGKMRNKRSYIEFCQILNREIKL